MTICTGSPPIEAGSGGSEKAKAFIPSTALSFACSSGLICCAVRVRSSHGFRIMPAMPWFGPRSAVDDKAQIGLGERGQRLVELRAIGVLIVEIGVLRRLGQREQHALVLFRRQLLLGVDVHEAERDKDRDREQRRHRAVVERAFEPAAVPVGERR